MRHLLSVAAAFVFGCASAGVKVTEAQVRQFTPGKSTYRDVVKELGPPTTESISSAGNRMITYQYAKAQLRPVHFIPVLGAFASSEAKGTTATFTFGPDSVLKEYSAGDSAIAGGLGTEGRKTPRDSDWQKPEHAAAALPVACTERGATRCNGLAVETCGGSTWAQSAKCEAGQECSASTLYCPDGACCH